MSSGETRVESLGQGGSQSGGRRKSQEERHSSSIGYDSASGDWGLRTGWQGHAQGARRKAGGS